MWCGVLRCGIYENKHIKNHVFVDDVRDAFETPFTEHSTALPPNTTHPLPHTTHPYHSLWMRYDSDVLRCGILGHRS